ncbi:MAG: VanZ family protein [Oxalobacteraceae bacterium]
MPFLVLIFIALIVYGSLFPFSDWTVPSAALFSFLASWPPVLEKADLIQNVLAYAPLGLFMVSWLIDSMRFWSALVLATLTGATLSFAMESIQQFIPSRTASTSDLAMNLLGTLAGGMAAAFLTHKTFSGAKLIALRNRWLRTGALPNIGLISLALWALSQTSPLVPTFDIAQLRHGLSLLFHSLQTPKNLIFSQTLTYAFYITALGLLTLTIGRNSKTIFAPFLFFIACILVLKVLVAGRQLSLEALMGAVLAVFLLLPLRRLEKKSVVSVTGIVLIAAGFTLSELSAVPELPTYAFNWIPFGGQMDSLNGLQNILDIFWPFFALAYFARYMTLAYHRAEVAVFGGITILAGLFGLEWFQQNLPGRYGDITQVLLGISGWVIPWFPGSTDYASQDPAPPRYEVH